MEIIKIQIADLSSPLEFQVKSEEEKAIYHAAMNDVNQLFDAWSQKYNRMSAKDIIATIALRLAYANVEHNMSEKRRTATLDEIEKNIDSILLFDNK